jgi:hypothetical protein
LLTAFVLFLKAFTKLEHPEEKWPLIVFLFAGSAVIVSLTVLHRRLHLPHVLVNVTTYVVEAIGLAGVAYLYASEAKRGLAITTALAVGGFIVAAIVTWKKGGSRRAHS